MSPVCTGRVEWRVVDPNADKSHAETSILTKSEPFEKAGENNTKQNVKGKRT